MSAPAATPRLSTHGAPTSRAIAAPTSFKNFATPRASMFALLCALTLAFMTLGMTSASAHDRLIDSNPADGAKLDKAPAAITLTFNEKVQNLGGQIQVTGKDSGEVAAGDPTVDGVTASLDLPADLANDTYTVDWRAVSADSHPIEGTFTFTVNDPNAAAEQPATEEPTDPAVADDATATEEPSDTMTTMASETPGTTETPETTDATVSDSEQTSEATDTNATDTKEDAPGLPWTGIVIGGVLGLAVGIIGMIVLQRRKDNDTEDNDSKDAK